MSSRPILPGSTIGVIGGGQLGRMFILEARRMGYRAVVLDPDPEAPAARVADDHIRAPLSDVAAARDLAARVDVVTLEWENADTAAVRALEEVVVVRPGSAVLEVAQNRIREKEAATRLGLRTARFHPVRSIQDLRDGLRRIGVPAILKTATGGYDGKGQRVVRVLEEADAAFAALEGGSRELILEERVPFELEASVICARGPDDTIATFPVVENLHRSGILDFTLAPARISAEVERKAREAGQVLIRGLGVVGLLAVELFIDAEGNVLVNEIAPRPHNSGHYTWEACSVSQFEQQLRAVCGLPLVEPVLLKPAAMANLLGEDIGTGAELQSLVEVLSDPLLSLHLYDKRTARPGRKMGHLTALADDPAAARDRVAAARAILASDYASSSPSAEGGES